MGYETTPNDRQNEQQQDATGRITSTQHTPNQWLYELADRTLNQEIETG